MIWIGSAKIRLTIERVIASIASRDSSTDGTQLGEGAMQFRGADTFCAFTDVP